MISRDTEDNLALEATGCGLYCKGVHLLAQPVELNELPFEVAGYDLAANVKCFAAGGVFIVG